MSGPEQITNHGIIAQLDLPEDFRQHNKEDNPPNHYLEYQARGAMAMICYEQSDEHFSTDDIMLIEKLLSEDLGSKESRRLNLTGDLDEPSDDSEVFNVISLCFVFGGYLTRNGTVMDIDRCTWDLRSIKDQANQTTLLVGHMKFSDGQGNRVDREVLLTLPKPPTENGCGYLWLEGNSQDLRRYQRKFLNAAAQANYI